MPVPAFHNWKSNAELFEDVRNLGYLAQDSLVLDPTYGLGIFWKNFRPDYLYAHDKKIDNVDFTDLPYKDNQFEVVVFDPPYKLNGTPDEEVDGRYGVDIPERWQDRVALMKAGFLECCRVLMPRDPSISASGYVLVKTQNQVCSGKVRWLTDMYTDWAYGYDLHKVDELQMYGHVRPQPMKGRRQRTAHGRPSSLLVFQKPKARR